MSGYKEAQPYNDFEQNVGYLVNPVTLIHPYNHSGSDGRLDSVDFKLSISNSDRNYPYVIGEVCNACQLHKKGVCTGLKKESHQFSKNVVEYKGQLKIVGWPDWKSSWVIEHFPDERRFRMIPASGGVKIVGNSLENMNLGTSLCSPFPPSERLG